MKFNDRISAGKKLTKEIPSKWKVDVVYGVANGGVVVAGEVAKQLGLRLEVSFVAKLPLPWNPEVAIGVVSVSGNVYTDDGVYRKIGLSYMELQKITRERMAFLKRRQGNIISEENLKPLDVKDKNILIVDDGLATGFTILGSIRDMKELKAKNIYIATPIAHKKAVDKLEPEVDGIAHVIISESRVFSVSAYYRSFEQVGDREVREIVRENRKDVELD